ncbi:ribbon-helix-helix domain-containing protein [Oceanobacillus sp. 143]|nr:ribbon-helix-helix domain-containing protein [Oceanobacillus sp. 143]
MSKLKNRTRISNAVDKDLWNKMQELSKTTQVPISKLLDNAINYCLNHIKRKR